jgi:hypothetical protein
MRNPFDNLYLATNQRLPSPHPRPLPRGEGEPSASLSNNPSAEFAASLPWSNTQLRTLFPLPWGEGQGEGEHDLA